MLSQLCMNVISLSRFYCDQPAHAGLLPLRGSSPGASTCYYVECATFICSVCWFLAIVCKVDRKISLCTIETLDPLRLHLAPLNVSLRGVFPHQEMSENILEWRRRWSPDLSAVPWTRFTIEGRTVFIKSHFSQTSYTALVYDFTTVWEEVAEPNYVKATAKKCNPNVEAPLNKLLQHLSGLLQEEQMTAKYSLSWVEPGQGAGGEATGLTIKVSSKLPQGVPFRWTLSLSRASDEVASRHLTVPLLTLVSELMRREKELHKLLKKKDEEIEDYKMAGAKVSKRYKLTQAFDDKAFNQEMIHSKAFRTHVETSGQKAFDGQGQDLYKEVMVTRAWMDRPAMTEEGSDEEGLMADDDALVAPVVDPTAPSWVPRLPGSVVADVPSMASSTLSPAKSSPSKSSPSKSPLKASPGPSAQDTELMRRQALEKRLAEEKTKLQVKKKKKKLF